MNALLFGAGGQDAHYLGEICKENGVTPIGVSRSGGDTCGDVGDRDLVEDLVRRYRPRFVFHLAAASTTRHDALLENHRTISTGTLHVLESARLHCPEARVFLTGSGVQFENKGLPISERDPFQASSPYAVSRIDSVHAGRYFRSLGLRVYVGYLCDARGTSAR
jgi:GDPmannose 4,6-dehydratase